MKKICLNLRRLFLITLFLSLPPWGISTNLKTESSSQLFSSGCFNIDGVKASKGKSENEGRKSSTEDQRKEPSLSSVNGRKFSKKRTCLKRSLKRICDK